MGRKHKHSKDKLHKTVSELSSHHHDSGRELELSSLHRRLKFDTCCLLLNPVKDKFMGLSDDSNFCYVFECDAIVKFLEKYKVHPISGQKVGLKDLIEINFHKNNDNHYHCPVLYKLLNQNSKIVVNKRSGHVYLYEAYYELNLKPSYFKDLLTDEPFNKDNDIAIIQDPSIAKVKWDVSNFHYVKNNLKLDDEEKDSRIRDIDRSSVLKSSLDEYRSKADSIVTNFNKIVGNDKVESNEEKSKKLDKINSAVYSDGALSSSVTSTVTHIVGIQRAALLTEEQILYPRIKKKGYIQLLTNFGPINFELYCDRTPKTCHNFLLLASRGYYDGTIFHRLIKNFIIQGGDPTGTGTGGQSAWIEPFKDECHGDLKHEGRGVLAMANSGPNTNKSQFYITLKGVWSHLDGKHTVFGRAVGGLENLSRIEDEVEVDKKDRPLKEIKIIRVIKYIDPFEDADMQINQERKKEQESDDNGINNGAGVPPNKPVKKFRSGVGAYIDVTVLSNKSTTSSDASKNMLTTNARSENDTDSSRKVTTSLSNKLADLEHKRQPRCKSYGNFSDW